MFFADFPEKGIYGCIAHGSIIQVSARTSTRTVYGTFPSIHGIIRQNPGTWVALMFGILVLDRRPRFPWRLTLAGDTTVRYDPVLPLLPMELRIRT